MQIWRYKLENNTLNSVFDNEDTFEGAEIMFGDWGMASLYKTMGVNPGGMGGGGNAPPVFGVGGTNI